jgi:urease accessory protein
MQNIIRHAWPSPKHAGHRIELRAGRMALAKRRWHGIAEDGAEFGFDLDHPLPAGTVLLETASAHYVLTQQSEAVLEVDLKETLSAARIAWSLGNLHFPIELDGKVLRVADDPAVRLYLERGDIEFRIAQKVFRPIQAAGHSHGHDH